jgi:hypothetical protein
MCSCAVPGPELPWAPWRSLACFVIQQYVSGLAATLTLASQTDRQKPADDKIKIAIEAALRHDVHRSADFEPQQRGVLRLGHRERMGNIMNRINDQAVRQMLLDKLQAVTGQQRASASQADLGMGIMGMPPQITQGLSAVGGALMQSVGQMIGQGAGQGRGRLRV